MMMLAVSVMVMGTILNILSSATLVMNNASGMAHMTQGSQNTSWQSCSQFLQAEVSTVRGPREVMIDLDGPGPLPPVGVLCELSSEGEFVTSIKHSNEEVTKVDGFQDRGSFHQVIHYHATPEQINIVMNRSTKCWQSLRFECKQSQLFGRESGQFKPYGWWVSWQEEKMDFWSGASPGSRQCACGVRGDCFVPEMACNCDSGHEDWLQDEGDISSKEHLPVRSLNFGDTGTPLDNKEGRFSLGQLKCVEDINREEKVIIANVDDENVKTTTDKHTFVTIETFEPNNRVTKKNKTSELNPVTAETMKPVENSPIVLTKQTIKEESDRRVSSSIFPISSKRITISIISSILFIILITFFGYVHYCRKTKGAY